MENSNLINKLFFLLLITACTTTNYNTQESYFIAKNIKFGLTEIVATPDRIIAKCEELDEDPDEGRYGFGVFILDEKNTVVMSGLNIRPDKENCYKHLKKVNTLLKRSKSVYIASRGSIGEEPLDPGQFKYKFPKHGTYYSNGQYLDWALISNDRGDCYNPHAKPKESCLEYPFPIEKHEAELKKNSN